ncbi:MAG: DUF3873 family protein [Bacteroidales bacterium]
MKTNRNSACTSCAERQEVYTKFHPTHLPQQTFFQYDYRDTYGELFSTVGGTLEICRERRDKWLQQRKKKFKLFIGMRKLGEFDTILDAKQYAQKSSLCGAFNLVGEGYRDSWFGF